METFKDGEYLCTSQSNGLYVKEQEICRISFMLFFKYSLNNLGYNAFNWLFGVCVAICHHSYQVLSSEPWVSIRPDYAYISNMQSGDFTQEDLWVTASGLLKLFVCGGAILW